MHVAGYNKRDCTDIERNRKTRLPTYCQQNSGVNLVTFVNEQSLVSSHHFEVLIGADHVLGLGREADFSK